jgi:hypothetical protein
LFTQSAFDTLITQQIPAEFLFPERGIAFWLSSKAAIRMPVPEASVDEYCNAPARQNKIRRAGEVAPVQPEPETGGMSRTPDAHLRLRVAARDSGHIGRSARRIDGVHQPILSLMPVLSVSCTKFITLARPVSDDRAPGGPSLQLQTLCTR